MKGNKSQKISAMIMAENYNNLSAELPKINKKRDLKTALNKYLKAKAHCEQLKLELDKLQEKYGVTLHYRDQRFFVNRNNCINQKDFDALELANRKYGLGDKAGAKVIWDKMIEKYDLLSEKGGQ